MPAPALGNTEGLAMSRDIEGIPMEKRIEFARHLDRAGVPSRCLSCCQDTTQIGNEYATFFISSEVERMPSERSCVPLILVTCTKCGFTAFYNAIVAGLLTPTAVHRLEVPEHVTLGIRQVIKECVTEPVEN